MNPNPLCIFGHQINKEQLNLWMVKYWQYKKDSCSSKASQYFESYFMFFLLAILLLTSIRWPSETISYRQSSLLQWFQVLFIVALVKFSTQVSIIGDGSFRYLSSYIPLMLKSNKSYHIILSPSWASSWFYYELFDLFFKRTMLEARVIEKYVQSAWPLSSCFRHL